MSKTEIKYKNNLARYRRRWRINQRQILQLMGEGERIRLWDIESGRSLPSLKTALKLSVILRVPVEFLYQDLYIETRERIRKREAYMPHGSQGVLPLFLP
jgi:DNA-binding XRE family transcriptional regulator